MAPKPAADVAAFAVSVEGKVALYMAAIPFVCGFLLAFAAIKFAEPKKPERQIRKGLFLSRYEDHSLRENQRFIFMICASVGGLNALIFFFVVSWAR